MFTIKRLREHECGIVLDLIRELAAYEKLEDQVIATEADLHKVCFEEGIAHVMLVRWDEVPVGYCIYFWNVSTFKCKKGLYIEDIYIKPEYRGRGLGKCLLQLMNQIAQNNDCGRIEWMCLDWNTSAQQVYESLGATKQPQWLLYRVDEEEMDGFAPPTCGGCH